MFTESEYAEYLRDNLKSILEDRHMTQHQLAEDIGITDVSMSHYVNGRRTPKAVTLFRMCDALGVWPTYFFKRR